MNNARYKRYVTKNVQKYFLPFNNLIHACNPSKRIIYKGEEFQVTRQFYLEKEETY